MAGGPPPPRRGGPPKPPPRRNADQGAPAVANPFVVPEDTDLPVANPFLAPEPGQPQPPQPPAHPQQSAPQQSAPHHAAISPTGSQPRAAVPLQVQPGVTAPVIKDAHAEFRRGSWKRPAILVGAAAIVVVGLVFAIPSGEDEAAAVAIGQTPELEQEAVIGRSVSPEVIQEPEDPLKKATQKDGTGLEPEQPEAPAQSPNRPDRSSGFAESFKASAGE